MSIVAIVGLGYVGLPLAVEFGKKRETFGYDSDADKVEAYRRGADPSGQITADELNAADRLTLASDPSSSATQADTSFSGINNAKLFTNNRSCSGRLSGLVL